MPANATVFLMGLAVGIGLLMFGLLVGYFLGFKWSSQTEANDRKQFLSVLQNLSNWTSEFAGDVSKYQSQLGSLSSQMQMNPSGDVPREEVLGLLAKIMHANEQLQERLDSAEQKLETQTSEISNYLTEARTDSLTGLLNRRAFDKATDEHFSSWQTKKQGFALGLIDIDHFKQINDTYGHPAGDAVLQSIAKTLKQELGSAVCVARYGGEEFGMLAKVSVDEAAAMLEQLRKTVANMEITFDGKAIPVTLSAGVSELGTDEKIGKLVRHADEALYAAKLGGRNRVYKHHGGVCTLVSKVVNGEEQVSLSAEESREREELESRVQKRLSRIVDEESQRHNDLLRRRQ